MAPPRGHRRTEGPARPHIVDDEMFRSALIRERRRADRTNQPFGLLLLDVDDLVRWPCQVPAQAAVEALAAAKHETDIGGWFARPSLLGVIVPEIRPPALQDACARVDARWRRELGKRFDLGAAARASIGLHLYPEPRQAGEDGLWPPDPILHPDLRQRLAQGSPYDGIKRALDLVGSGALLGLLSPLLAVIATLVKLSSPGPVLFRQVRVGYLTRPFTMLKFRTMYSDADHQPHQEFVRAFIKGENANHEPGTAPFFKLTNDPRITRVGRLLRSTSLDELPQLWNVLRGEMSLVGPRPPLPYEFDQYAPWHRRRVLEAKPGITGLWQVAGRSRTTFDEMVRLDLEYAGKRSLWTDLKILFATPASVISRRGAC